MMLLGHRGFRGMLENTMPAFRRAMRYAHGVELDVRLTRDGRVVTHHDPGFTRGGDYYLIGDLTLLELRRLHPLGNLIPELSRVLREFPGAAFNVDVKEVEVIGAALNAVERFGMMERTVFSSESPGIVRMLIRECPDCRVGFSIVGYSSIVHLPTLDGLYSLHVPLDALKYIGYSNLISLLGAFRRRGLKIYLWNYSMDESLWVPRLLGSVDAIISDDPALLRKSFYAKGIGIRGDADVE